MTATLNSAITDEDRAENQAKRDAQNEIIMHYVHCVNDIQLEMDRIDAEIRNTRNEAQKKALRGSLPQPMKPKLVVGTVGSGKSRSIQSAIRFCDEQGLKTNIIVPTHDLADSCSSDIEAATGVRPLHIFGRKSADEVIDDPSLASWLCWKKEEAERAAKQNQIPSQSICQKCPHWFSHILESGSAEKKLEASAFFTKHGLKESRYANKQCKYLPQGIVTAMQSDHNIMVQQSFSEAFGEFEFINTFGERTKMRRLQFVDEKLQLSKEIEINLPAVAGWKESLTKTAKALREKYNKSSLADVLIKPAGSDGIDVETCFTNLISALNDKRGIDEAEIVKMYETVLEAGGIKKNTAAWELSSLLSEDEREKTDKSFWIPLRALHNLARCIKNGTLRKTDTAIFVYEESPIIENALSAGNTIFLDATASIAMRALIDSVGGDIDIQTFKQNLHITQFSGHLFARGAVRKQGYKDKAKLRMIELKEIAGNLKSIPGSTKWAILTHKAWLKYSSEQISDDAAEAIAEAFFEETGVYLGWYGAHDRGHNKWEGCHLALVGMPLLSADAIDSAYASDRAALIAHGVNWPAFNKQIPELSSKDWEEGKAPVPSQEFVRGWLLDLYAATIAQAIGRARAINSDSLIHVYIYGGLQTKEMNEALKTHGVIINERKEQKVHLTRKMWAARSTNKQQIIQAALLLHRNDQKISRRAVRDILVGMDSEADDKCIDAILKEMRDKRILPPPQMGSPKRTDKSDSKFSF